MRTIPKPDCAVCGTRGKIKYVDLRDRLYSAPGEWTLKECSNDACGLTWLDPFPVAEDLGQAYGDYFTHDAGARRAPSRAKTAYLRSRHGDRQTRQSLNLVDRLLAIGFALRARRRMEVDDQSFHLRKGEGAQRVLDVGCGSGDELVLLGSLGWDTLGIEFDERAAAAARSQGLTVLEGSLADQKLEDCGFDAVVLSHVIEHVPDPLETIAECHRILRPGGRLVMLTPNAASMGHRSYGKHWMALDPPRHLHIFTPNAMHSAISKAGFGKINVLTSASGADRISMTSQLIRANGHAELGARRDWLTKRRGRFFQARQMALLRFDRTLGDQIVAQATK